MTLAAMGTVMDTAFSCSSRYPWQRVSFLVFFIILVAVVVVVVVKKNGTGIVICSLIGNQRETQRDTTRSPASTNKNDVMAVLAHFSEGEAEREPSVCLQSQLIPSDPTFSRSPFALLLDNYYGLIQLFCIQFRSYQTSPPSPKSPPLS